MIINHLQFLSFFILAISGCGDSSEERPTNNQSLETAPGRFADVVEVSVNGASGRYRFQVTLSSPDTGCDQYADWWEIVSLDGELLYRRVLGHSHVNEQPFTRSGGPVPVSANQEVWIRAHMNNTGYGGSAFRGTVAQGFSRETLPGGFARELSQVEPLPEFCAF